MLVVHCVAFDAANVGISRYTKNHNVVIGSGVKYVTLFGNSLSCWKPYNIRQNEF